MRVLLTCKKRTWCGETRYVAELANSLAASGHLVTVAARRESELWPHLTGVSKRITLHLEHNFLAVRKLASDLLRLTGLFRPDLFWAFNYSRMMEASIVGFMVGGMFLNRGHFDLLYHFIAIVSCCVLVAEAELSGQTEHVRRPARGQLSVRIRSPLPNANLPRWERAH